MLTRKTVRQWQGLHIPGVATEKTMASLRLQHDSAQGDSLETTILYWSFADGTAKPWRVTLENFTTNEIYPVTDEDELAHCAAVFTTFLNTDEAERADFCLKTRTKFNESWTAYKPWAWTKLSEAISAGRGATKDELARSIDHGLFNQDGRSTFGCFPSELVRSFVANRIDQTPDSDEVSRIIRAAGCPLGYPLRPNEAAMLGAHLILHV